MRSVMNFLQGLGVLVIGAVLIALLVGEAPSSRSSPTSTQGPALPSFSLVLPGDVISRPRYRTKVITRADMGDRWPFTVDEATIVCVMELGPAGKFFVVDDEPFAATGAASGIAKSQGLAFYFDRTQKRQVPRLLDPADRLWAEAPRPEGLDPDEPWMRVNIGPVISALDPLGCRG